MVEEFDPVTEAVLALVTRYRVYHRPDGPFGFTVHLRLNKVDNRWVLWISAPGHSFGDLPEAFAPEDLVDALAFATKLVEQYYNERHGITEREGNDG